MKEEDIREEQRRNGMSLGEEQQLKIHKIPLKIHKTLPSPNYAISYKKIEVNERLEMIRQTLYNNELYMADIATKLNEVLDYLQSKGE